MVQRAYIMHTSTKEFPGMVLCRQVIVALALPSAITSAPFT